MSAASTKVAVLHLAKDSKAQEYVKEKAEELKAKGYDDSKAFAVAWSIYCKYKSKDIPDSEGHCKQPSNSYFPNKKAVASRFLKEARLSPSNFWGLVGQMGWGKKTTDYKKLKKEMMGQLTAEQATEFRNLFDKASSQLSKAIYKWENQTGKNIEVGDDGFDDLRAHIIGLGRKEFQQVMKDPELAYNRANAGDYKESFSYAIPDRYDYQKELKRAPAGGGQWPDGAVLWYADFPKNMVGAYQQFLHDVLNATEEIRGAQTRIETLEKELGATLREGMKISDAFKTYMRANTPKGSKVELAHRGFPDRAWRPERDSLTSWVNELSQEAKWIMKSTRDPKTHKDG